MSKQLPREQRRERDIAAIEVVLWDLAIGANDGYAVEDECGLTGALGSQELGSFLASVCTRFKIGPWIDRTDYNWTLRHALDWHHFKHLDSVYILAKHLYNMGVRA